jgi:hypothetical protein
MSDGRFSRWVAVLLLGCGSGQDVAADDGETGEDETSTSGSSSGNGEADLTSSVSSAEGPSSSGDASSNDTGVETDEDTVEIEGQTIVVAVGNWGYRGMTVDGDRWIEIMNEPPPGGDDHTADLLRGVGYGNGMFVAVGGDANGMIMRTIDGVNWEEDLWPEGTNWLGDVAYQDGVWVAVGGNGVIVRSTDDGDSWTENPQRLARAGRTIIAAQGRLVAAGDGGSIAVSTDLGLSWDESTDTSGIGFALAYGQGTFVGFASQWNGSGFDTACIVSPDAMAWSSCPIESSAFGRPASGEGVVVVQTAEGYAWVDRAGWSTAAVSFPTQLVRGDGVWVGASYQRRWHASTHGGPWQSYEHPHGVRDLAAGAVAR